MSFYKCKKKFPPCLDLLDIMDSTKRDPKLSTETEMNVNEAMPDSSNSDNTDSGTVDLSKEHGKSNQSTFFTSLFSFFAPIYFNFKSDSAPIMKPLFNYVEEIWNSLTDFIGGFQSVWDIRIENWIYLANCAKNSLIKYLQSPAYETLKKLYAMFYYLYGETKKCLKEMDEIYMTCVPYLPDKKLKSGKTGKKYETVSLKQPIRWMCFDMLKRLAQRMFAQLDAFIIYSLGYIDKYELPLEYESPAAEFPDSLDTETSMKKSKSSASSFIDSESTSSTNSPIGDVLL